MYPIFKATNRIWESTPVQLIKFGERREEILKSRYVSDSNFSFDLVLTVVDYATMPEESYVVVKAISAGTEYAETAFYWGIDQWVISDTSWALEGVSPDLHNAIIEFAHREVLKYAAGQPRDDHGRWASGGGSNSANQTTTIKLNGWEAHTGNELKPDYATTTQKAIDLVKKSPKMMADLNYKSGDDKLLLDSVTSDNTLAQKVVLKGETFTKGNTEIFVSEDAIKTGPEIQQTVSTVSSLSDELQSRFPAPEGSTVTWRVLNEDQTRSWSDAARQGGIIGATTNSLAAGDQIISVNSHTRTIDPMMLIGQAEDNAPLAGNPQKYAIIHEWGHVVDNVGMSKSNVVFSMTDEFRAFAYKHQKSLSMYGHSAPQEGFAEFFSHYYLNKYYGGKMSVMDKEFEKMIAPTMAGGKP